MIILVWQVENFLSLSPKNALSTEGRKELKVKKNNFLNRVVRLYLLVALLFLSNRILTQAQYRYERKSEDAAAALSFFGTALPVASGIWLGSKDYVSDRVAFSLIAGGLLIGPSFGYCYAGLYKRALLGVGVRTFIIGGTLLAEELREQKKKNCSWEGCGIEGPSTIVLIGSGVFLVATLADLMYVTEAVKKRNRALQESGWMLMPKYFAKHETAGLELQFRF